MFSKRSLCILYSILVLLPMGICQADTFFEAAARGNMGLVKSMLKGSPALVKTVDKDGATALHYAAATGKRTVAEFLLSSGADVNARKKDGVTPLHVAAALGQKDMAEFLIYKKASVDSVDNKGRTPLTLARERRHPMVAKLLVAAGAKDPSAAARPQPKPVSKTPLPALPKTPDKKLVEAPMDAETAGLLLWTAACKGDAAKVKSVLMSAAGPNLVNYETKGDRMTPLQGAASYGKIETARMLILQGAEVNHKDANGSTPLQLAAFHGFTKVVNILLSRGADLNARDNAGETPIHLAANGGHSDTVALLVAKGASVDAKNNAGLTPLHEAAINGHTHMVKLLMQKGADKDAKDNAGRTALEYARDRNHPATAEALSTLVPAPAESAAAPTAKPAPEKPVVIIKKTAPASDKKSSPAAAKPAPAKAPAAAVEKKPVPAKVPAVEKKTVPAVKAPAAKKNPAPAVKAPAATQAKPVPAKAPAADPKKQPAPAPKPKAAAKAMPAPLPAITPEKDAPSSKEMLDFFEAVATGDTKTVKKLLATRSEKDLVVSKDKEGMLPIHWAAFNGKADILQMLVKSGADVNAKTSSRLNLYSKGKSITFDAGTTPAAIAGKLGNKDAVKILKSAGAK